MDEIVLQAMNRWPNVPAVYGWLKLDFRGRWLLKGDPITNHTIKDFIGRNYLADDKGQWYFQNGPQKVFIELEYTPYIIKLWRKADGILMAETHNKIEVSEPISCWLDNQGNLSMKWESGLGTIEPQSLDLFLDLLISNDGQKLSEKALDSILLGNRQILKSIKVQWNNRHLPLQFLEFEKFPKHFSFNPFPLPPNENSL